MITTAVPYLAGTLMLLGSLFSLLAGIGILRLPDVYTRLHAAGKAGPLGAGMILAGAGLASIDPTIVFRAGFGVLFLLVTAPLAAHLLARAAFRSGVPMAGGPASHEAERNQ